MAFSLPELLYDLYGQTHKMMRKRGSVLNAIIEDVKDSVVHVAEIATSPSPSTDINTEDRSGSTTLRKEHSLPAPKSQAYKEAWKDLFGEASEGSSPLPRGTPEKKGGLLRASSVPVESTTGRMADFWKALGSPGRFN